MRNIIIALATTAISVSASAQDFPFNTFEGQVNDTPFNGVVETPVMDTNFNPMNVMFLDVEGDGRFDYMGQGSTVVDLDGWHATMDWRDSTNIAIYSTQQEEAFDFATTSLFMPRAIPGVTGEWNTATAKFEYLAENDVKKWNWQSPTNVYPDGGCEGTPPVMCGSVPEFKADQITCVTKKFIERLRELDLLRSGCNIVIIDKNPRLRVPNHTYEEVFSCYGVDRDYRCYYTCDNDSRVTYPIEYKDDDGTWKIFPIGMDPRGILAIDDQGMPGGLGRGGLVADPFPPYGDGRNRITGGEINPQNGGYNDTYNCFWASWILKHVSCKTSYYKWIEH